MALFGHRSLLATSRLVDHFGRWLALIAPSVCAYATLRDSNYFRVWSSSMYCIKTNHGRRIEKWGQGLRWVGEFDAVYWQCSD